MRNLQSLRLLLADKDKEIEQLKKELTEEKKAYIRMYNMYVEKENIINEVYKYLDEKKDVPEWWDTDFMICMVMLKGGNGNLKRIFDEMNGSDKE